MTVGSAVLCATLLPTIGTMIAFCDITLNEDWKSLSPRSNAILAWPAGVAKKAAFRASRSRALWSRSRCASTASRWLASAAFCSGVFFLITYVEILRSAPSAHRSKVQSEPIHRSHVSFVKLERGRCEAA
jgi:hypothetical protein